jgi:hypothetical protein
MYKVSRRIFVVAALAAMSACAMFQTPADLDLRLTRPTTQGLYVVAMRPLVTTVAVNQIHPWEIRIVTAAGQPVAGAHIAFDGGMPQHGHGLPTQPRVTEELGDGRYRLDGMKFSMTGWWEMKVKIDAAPGKDQVTFNTVLPMPAAAPAVADAR